MIKFQTINRKFYDQTVDAQINLTTSVNMDYGFKNTPTQARIIIIKIRKTHLILT